VYRPGSYIPASKALSPDKLELSHNYGLEEKPVTSTFQVKLHSELGSRHTADLTLELVRDLQRTDGLTVETHAKESIPGQKSDTLLGLGHLVIGLASTGALAAFIGVLRAYFERDRTLRITLEHPETGKIKIEASNLSPRRLEELLSKLSAVAS